MRIAFLGLKGLPSKGGAERVAEALAVRLSSKHTITVYCSDRYTPPDARLAGVRLVRLPTLPGKHLQPLSLFLVSALHAVLRGNYDLVHLHNVEASFILPILRLRYPVIGTSHGPAYARAKWGPLARVLLRANDTLWAAMANVLTAVSRPQAEAYRQRLHREVVYIPNGVDNPPTGQDALPDDIGALQPSRFILFAAKRLDPTKGCHLLLQAYGRLESAPPLLVVGDFDGTPAYKKQILDQLGPTVTLRPAIEARDAFLRLVRRASLFVFPSTVEASSMMLLEVASLGVPLVASDIAENRAILPACALTFHSGSSEDLAEKLQWALDHPNEMAGIATAVQAWVRERYCWDMIVDEYDRLYQAVGSNHHPH